MEIDLVHTKIAKSSKVGQQRMYSVLPTKTTSKPAFVKESSKFHMFKCDVHQSERWCEHVRPVYRKWLGYAPDVPDSTVEKVMNELLDMLRALEGDEEEEELPEWKTRQELQPNRTDFHC